jgi:hypothetical protein
MTDVTRAWRPIGPEDAPHEDMSDLGGEPEQRECSCCGEVGPGAPGAGGAEWICDTCDAPYEPDPMNVVWRDLPG